MTHFQRLIGLSPIVLGMCALLGTEGCRRSGRNDLLPVEGQILDAAGQPAAGVQVILRPLNGGAVAAGQTGTDGRFKLSTEKPSDGVAPGEYAVCAIWPAASQRIDPLDTDGPDRLNGRYVKPDRTPWKIKIESETREIGPFRIK